MIYISFHRHLWELTCLRLACSPPCDSFSAVETLANHGLPVESRTASFTQGDSLNA